METGSVAGTVVSVSVGTVVSFVEVQPASSKTANKIHTKRFMLLFPR
jgi:hypothetical protein